MADIPVAGHFSSNNRTEGEVKAALEDQRTFITQLAGGGTETTLTIASGAVTPTTWAHQVDTEGAASTDDLTNVNQGTLPNGSLLLLRNVASGRAVVVKHAAGGTGQVSLKTGADFSLLDPADYLLLKRVGTQWEEIQRLRRADAFPGGATSGFRVLLDLDAAPVGWVRDTTTVNDRVPRIVTAARAHGGSWTVSGLTMPHTHPIPALTLADGGSAPQSDAVLQDIVKDTANGNLGRAAGTIAVLQKAKFTTGTGTSDAASTSAVVSDGTWRPLHRDMILCYPAN